MKSCTFEKLLPDYLQGELTIETRHQLEAHFEICEHCAAKLEELADIHQILSARLRPEPTRKLVRNYRNYLRKYFPSKTSPAAIIEKIKRRWGSFVHSRQIPARIAKAFALIIMGVFIGKYVLVPSVEAPKTKMLTSIPTYAITPTDLKQMNDYFVKSEILLLAIENWQGNAKSDSSDLLFDKKVAQNLLLHSQIIHQKATQLYDSELLSFLDRMEILLLEISNVDNKELFQVFKEAKNIIKETNLLQSNKQFQNLFIQSELNNI